VKTTIRPGVEAKGASSASSFLCANSDILSLLHDSQFESANGFRGAEKSIVFNARSQIHNHPLTNRIKKWPFTTTGLRTKSCKKIKVERRNELQVDLVDADQVRLTAAFALRRSNSSDG
jgi:hypothetical protein